LFATWKFDEPRRQKLLTDTHMTRRIRIPMEFHGDRHEVRSVDEEFSVDATAGSHSGWLGASFSLSYGRGGVRNYQVLELMGRAALEIRR
jgi:hypothetical protein